ncbi:MAG: ABC transporter permease [Rhizobium sp.]|nr:ABC transporter permease [Rhizobium sp.]
MERPSALALILAAVVAIFLLMPLFAVVPVSFTPARFLSMPSGEWSFRHYIALVENPAWLQATWLSIRIAVLSSLISTGLALAFSLGMWMYRPAMPGLYYGFVLMPMVAPPVVSAITIYFFLTSLSKVNDLVGYDTVVGVAIAHAIMIAPFAVVLITVALSQVDRRIDLAARGFGASVSQRIFLIILPNIKFGVFTAAFLAFVLSWEEIGVTLFITSVNAVTLPRMMWMGLRDNIDPAIAAISVLLIVVVIVVILTKTIIATLMAKKT